MTIPRFLPPVIAHRGASALAPENTLAALKLAKESGALWVELDAKLTSDGVPILMHDDTLDRTTNGAGNVADMDWADIQKLDAGGWFDNRFRGERVPHLGEVLQFVIDNNLRLNLEIKPCPGRAKATAMVTLIEAAKWWPQDHPPPLISSFDEETLSIAAQLHPHWPRSFLFDDWNGGWQETATRIGAEALGVDADLLIREHTHVLMQSGFAVFAFTVNDPQRAKELLSDGVHAVFCNDPKTMIEAL